jgi:C1A family cysteine protease
METEKRVYGWVRDHPTIEEPFLLSNKNETLPVKKELENLPPVYDQGQLGSCTANALGGIFEYEQIQSGFKDFMPSRLYIYYNERKMTNSVDYDSGSSISIGIKVMTTKGVCPEKTWPYIINKFKLQPSDDSFKQGSHHQVLVSKKVPDSVLGLKTMINMDIPIALGFTVYESFESAEVAQTGIMPLPKQGEQVLGGHAVVCVGYDDERKLLKMRNSWGPNWGLGGYFWMPYDYVDKLKLAADFWAVTKNEGIAKKLNNK